MTATTMKPAVKATGASSSAVHNEMSHGQNTGKRIGAVAVRLGAIATFAVILIYFALFAPGFLSSFNLINVVEQSAILGVLAFGMAVVIIGGGSNVTEGGIDLSIAANMGLCAAVFATVLQAGYPDAVAILAAIIVGIAVEIGRAHV